MCVCGGGGAWYECATCTTVNPALELSDFHQIVQHIGNTLPVDVLKFYIFSTSSDNHA